MTEVERQADKRASASTRPKGCFGPGASESCPRTLRRATALGFALAFGAGVFGCASPEDPPAADPLAAAPAPASAALPAGSAAVVGLAPAAVHGYPSVIILEPTAPETFDEPPPVSLDPVFMDQYGMAFVPNLLVIDRGQTVEFGNSEDVSHNVHVVERESGDTLINAATPVPGSSVRYTFEEAGEFSVMCGVHATMAATILVTSGALTTIAEADGAFVVPAVPHGAYTIRVWSIDPGMGSEQAIEVAGARTEVTVPSGRGSPPR